MKISAIMLTVVIIAALAGCENKEQESSRLEGEKTAADNVVKYVEEKYGFTPELVSLVTDSHEGMWGINYSDHVIAEMTHDGHDFIVYSAFDGSDARDDYQQQEIQSALEKEVQSRIPGTRKVEISSYCPIRSEDYTGRGIELYRSCFDGSDLSTVISEKALIVYTVNADLSGDLGWFDSLTDPEQNSVIISYRSDEALSAKSDLAHWFTNGTTGRIKEALYITECRASSGMHEKYELTEAEGLTYVACDSTGAPTDIGIEKIDDTHYRFTVPDGGCAELFLPKNWDDLRFYDNSEQFTTHLEGDYLQANMVFGEGLHNLVLYVGGT